MKVGAELPPFFGVNAAIAASLYLVDVGLNSSIEYGDLPGQDASDNSSDTIVTFVQVLLQITALANLLVMLGGTFLFRSGLFGLLYTQFRAVLLTQMLYITLTVILGVARVVLVVDAPKVDLDDLVNDRVVLLSRQRLLSSGIAHVDIWHARGYTVLSSIHKLGALGYYACSIYAVEQLRQRKFYTHEYWMRR